MDTSQLQNAVAGFQTVAGDVNAAVQQALSQTQGGSLEADPWGSDPLGSAFGAQYQPAAEQFTQALGLLSPMFGQIANTLDTAVKLATAGNDNAIEIAQSINKGI